MSQVAIFDFDGTIANTLSSIIKLFNEIAPKYNLATIKDSERERLKDSSARELLKKYKITPLKLLRLIKEVRSKLKKYIQDASIVEGMEKVFPDLKKHGVKIGIVTSNSTENVRLFLRKHNITEVDFIHSESNLFGKGKVLAHLIQQQRLNKEKVVYVGDEVRDVDAAHKAGVPIIAVTWGFNSQKRLKQTEPDYLISEPEEISEKLVILKGDGP